MYHVINTYLGIFIMMIGIILFAYIILDNQIRISKIKLLTVIIFSSIVYTYTYINYVGALKTIIIFLVNILIYKVIFKISYYKSIFLTILYIFILLIADMLELFFITKILSVSKEFCYDEFAGSIAGNLTVCLLFILITYLLRKILRKLIEYKIEDNVKIVILSTLMFVCIAMFFYIFANAYKVGNNTIEYLIVMGVSMLILICLLKQTIENKQLTKKYDKLLEFMTTYEDEIENQRILRHENKNEILNIKGQIIDNYKKDLILEYIDNILKDKNKVKYEEYAKFKYLPANGIKGLCYFKTQEAQNKGITVGINISSQIDKSNVYDLTVKEQRNFGKILGVILDNAIEASSTSKNKSMGIEAYNKKGEFQMIISNTYDNNIDINKLGKEKFSTKGKNRGHGLLLVKNIIENNKIFEVETKPNDNLYIQYIKIKKSN